MTFKKGSKNKVRDHVERAFDEVHGVADTLTAPIAPLDGAIHGVARGLLNWATDQHPDPKTPKNPPPQPSYNSPPPPPPGPGYYPPPPPPQYPPTYNYNPAPGYPFYPPPSNYHKYGDGNSGNPYINNPQGNYY